MWLDIGIVALFLFAVYAFIEMVGWRTRWLSHRTDRTAEDMYQDYADSPRQQQRYARQHGGSWAESSGAQPPPRPAPPPDGKS
jgi:hypothetical protein